MDVRWNSTYLMLERFLEIKTAVILFLSDSSISIDDPPNLDDWKVAEKLVEVLQPLYGMTNDLSAEKQVTISLVIPMTRVLLLTYETDEDEFGVAARLKLELFKSIKKRLGETVEDNKIYAVSTLLDPRFKHKAFFTGNAKVENAKKFVKIEAFKIGLLKEPEENGEEESLEPPKKKSKDPWSLWDSKVKSMKKEKNKPAVDIIDAELEKFLSDPILDRSDDPLTWWNSLGQTTYPNLYQIFMKVMIVPASSVPSERLFSKAGIVLNYLRNRLDPKVLNMILCLNKNLSIDDFQKLLSLE